jgi:hypothetical protein
MVPKVVHQIFFDAYIPYMDKCEEKFKGVGFEYIRWDIDRLKKEFPTMYKMYGSLNHYLFSDIARMVILKKYGGFYIDGDVDIIDAEGFISLCDHSFVCGKCFDREEFYLNAVFGSEPNSEILNTFIRLFSYMPDKWNRTAKVSKEYARLLQMLFNISIRETLVDDVLVVSKDVFNLFGEYRTRNTLCIHLCLTAKGLKGR